MMEIEFCLRAAASALEKTSLMYWRVKRGSSGLTFPSDLEALLERTLSRSHQISILLTIFLKHFK
jgi:hypothetical protein